MVTIIISMLLLSALQTEAHLWSRYQARLLRPVKALRNGILRVFKSLGLMYLVLRTENPTRLTQPWRPVIKQHRDTHNQ
jgi:hypothetical protein